MVVGMRVRWLDVRRLSVGAVPAGTRVRVAKGRFVPSGAYGCVGLVTVLAALPKTDGFAAFRRVVPQWFTNDQLSEGLVYFGHQRNRSRPETVRREVVTQSRDHLSNRPHPVSRHEEHLARRSARAHRMGARHSRQSHAAYKTTIGTSKRTHNWPANAILFMCVNLVWLSRILTGNGTGRLAEGTLALAEVSDVDRRIDPSRSPKDG
jgi:hypothetical protein